jgi:Cu/Ag efflux protein CusF
MIRAILITLTIALGMFACGSGEAPPTEEAAPATEAETPSGPQHYHGKGVVEAIDIEGGQVTLAHEDIPGFMNAMTMAFDVKNPSLLEQLTVGQEVQFSLAVEADGTYYIDDIGEEHTH